MRELRRCIGVAGDAPTYGAGGAENIAPWDHAVDELHTARRHPFAAGLLQAWGVTPDNCDNLNTVRRLLRSFP